MIGDDIHGDIEGALDNGLQACLVQTGKYQAGDEKRIDGEFLTHLWRDPAGADLVARKAFPIQDDDVEAAFAQPPGTARTARAAADDENVAVLHAVPHRPA